jgi:hypothetical protein
MKTSSTRSLEIGGALAVRVEDVDVEAAVLGVVGVRGCLEVKSADCACGRLLRIWERVVLPPYESNRI